MTYTLTYRRRFWPFKKKIFGVYSHARHTASDKMCVSVETGIVEIRNWSDCEIFLGQDWEAEFDRREKLNFEAKLGAGLQSVPNNSTRN